LAERLLCKQEVAGSNPAGSISGFLLQSGNFASAPQFQTKAEIHPDFRHECPK
jgi:hypothetical protein